MHCSDQYVLKFNQGACVYFNIQYIDNHISLQINSSNVYTVSQIKLHTKAYRSQVSYPLARETVINNSSILQLIKITNLINEGK